MDERKLTELFRGAVPDAPPPSFEYRDVAAESYRQRRRQRNALLGGSVLGVVLLASAAAVSVALWMGTEGGSGAAVPANSGGGGNGEIAPNEVPSKDGDRSLSGDASDGSFPPQSPKQGGTASGNAGPPGPGSTPSGCEKADPELAAALAGELRVSPTSGIPVDIACPVGSRGVAFPISGGIVSVVVSPKDAQFGNPTAGQPQRSALRAATAADGRHVFIVSEPEIDGGEPPLEADLQGILNRVAAGLR